jgi:TRAP-type C4-dicarboxylate transport system permease small subunit
MNRWLDRTDRVLEWVMISLMIVLVLDVTWQVVARYLIGEASSFSEEVARFLLIWIGLLGAAYAYRKKMHLAFDYFTEKAEGRILKWMNLLIHFVIALFSLLVLVLGGFYLVFITWELNQVSASLQIPLAVVYTALPLSGLLILLYSAGFIRDTWENDVQTEVKTKRGAA